MAKTDVANRLIWFKGQIMNVNEAMVNVLSPTSQFGLNVFEGIPCYWNDDQKQLYAFRLSDHYDRLIRSAKLIQLDCKYTKEDFQKALVDTVKANEYDENLSVRQTLFVDGFGSWGSEGPVEMFVAPIPRGRTAAEYNKKGLNCCFTSWRRISDENLSPRIKCGANYINRKFMFELLANGTVEKLGDKIKAKGIPFGFGGIATLDGGALPGSMVLKEHVRLGSSMVIVSRSFCNTDIVTDLNEVKRVFNTGISGLRALEKETAHADAAYLEENEKRFTS